MTEATTCSCSVDATDAWGAVAVANCTGDDACDDEVRWLTSSGCGGGPNRASGE